MSLKGIIFSVKAGATVADAFLEKVVEQNQSFAGVATAVQQDGSPMLVTILNTGPTSVDDVKEQLEIYKDSTCLWHFGNVEGAFGDADVQPFTVIEEVDGVADVVMFLEGNFEDKGGEAEVATTLIIPFLKRIWKGCADVPEFMEDLQTDDSVAAQMNLYYQGRGSITILGSNGIQLTFGNNALLTEYEWGWASQPCGYVAEAAAPPVVEAKKPGFGNSSRRVVAAAPVTSAAGKTTQVEKVVTAAHVEAKQLLKPGAGKSETPEMWGPGDDCTTKNQIKEWYVKNNGGVIPPGYKDKPLVAKIPAKGFDALKDRPVASVTPITQSTTSSTQVQKSNDVIASKQVTDEVLPVVPPKQKEWLKNTFMKRGSVQRTVSDGQVIIDPKRMQATEAKFPTYVEMAGLESLRDTAHYEHADRILLIKEAPEAAAVLLMNTTHALAIAMGWDKASETAPQTQTNEPARASGPRTFGTGRKVS